MEKYRFSTQLQTAFEELQQPFAIYQFIDRRVVTLVLSEGFCELFGYEDKSQAYYDMDNDMYKGVHPDDTARIADAAVRFATEGGRYEVIYRSATRNKSGYTIVHAQGRHVYMEDGTRLAHVWYTDEGPYSEEPQENESGLKRAMNSALREESMLKASSYDYLTGLPNMTYFFERAEAEKAAILERGGQPALLYIDFIGMQFFNASHGFAEGNNMLRAFARIISHLFGNENSCRIGADHFALVTEESGLEDKLDRLFAEFGELYGGKTPPVHVGIYPRRIENVPASSACDRAKLACATLKGSYTSAYSYYNDGMRQEALEKQYIIENLDTAMREKWIRVYLQPIVRTVNEKVCDVEALARWNDPQKGLLSPASFIPAIEEAGLIWKLDLYMVDQVLETIKRQIAEGLSVIPHSINLSRVDFDACDIVEEIRKRVDKAGVRRDRITIEITESVIGGDMEFMKKQVERFRALGFPVWMDDFGSGYSSMDVLQSIRFDVIKFDMSFMQKLDQGYEGKVILTELMRMATSLDVDTVCEGVETESQARFLREIGCSKLQGYYYSKPVPFDTILDMRKTRSLIENENPEESEYYESIGRMNLFDLGVVASEDDSALRRTFSTIPIAIVEVRDGMARYVRSNRSYRDFIMRFFGADITDQQSAFSKISDGYTPTSISMVKECCGHGNSRFFDDKMPDGSVVHSFARRISVNPVNGSAAVVIAVLSVAEPDEKKLSLGRIAALAGNYIALYIVDPITEEFAKYSSSEEYAQLGLTEKGEHFFEQVKTDGEEVLYPEDRERLLCVLTRENVLREIRENGLFVYNYRLLIGEKYVPVSLRGTLVKEDDGEKIIFGVNRLFAKEPTTNESEIIYTHIAYALARGYTDLYYVNMDTDEFIEYHTDDNLGVLTEARRGADFFEGCERDVKLFVHPEDQQKFVTAMSRDFLDKALDREKVYEFTYRRIMNDREFYVSMRVSRMEDDKSMLVIAVSDVDELMRKRMLEERMLEERTIYARLHAITGGFVCVYVVDPETGRYREFSSTDDYEASFSQAKEGTDFFGTLREAAGLYSHPEDRERVLSRLTQENVMAEIQWSGLFTLGYRIMKEEQYAHFQLKAAMVEEKEGMRLIIGLSDIDAQVRQEEEYERRLAQAQTEANIDALTGVKNKHAYVIAEETIDRLIKEHHQPPFAVVVFDVNDLKTVNDTDGHRAGDDYLCDACKAICDVFKRSPVYRVGGDEFVVISRDTDYENIENLLEQVRKHNTEALQSDGVVIACGMAKFENDPCLASVFERADRNMYRNKSTLKSPLKE